MSQLRAIIFDLDGTLLDSAPDIRHALNRILTAHGRREVTLEEVKGMLGDGLLTTMNRAFVATGTAIPPADSYTTFQEFVTHYRSITPDPTQIYPHVLTCLRKFTERGVKLGVCTNKQEAASLQLLEKLHLAPYFGFVAGGDTFPVHKPNPGHVTGVMAKLGVAATETVMVGDGPHDVKAAKGAGIPCIVMTHGYGADIENLGADGLLSGLDGLEPLLSQRGFTY